MKIILIRHGQTEWNKKEKEFFRGRADIPLNQTGIIQAQKTAQHLKRLDFPIKKVYSSPLQRAIQTAQAIAGQLELPHVEIEEGFIEFDYGQWEGQALSEIKRRFPQDYEYWTHEPGKLNIPEGETFQQVKDRVKGCLDSVMERSQGKNIVIVAHKAINKVIIGLLLGSEEKDFWEVEQDLACINIFDVHDGKAVTKTFNDIRHLLRKG